MDERWRSRARALLGRTAMAKPLRALVQRRFATVLVYHQPRPEVLDGHLSHLRGRGYRFISLARLVAAVRGRDRAKLPPRSLVLTIDDGWRGNRSLLPVLAKHRCPVTIFVCAGLIGTRRTVWDFALPKDPGLNRALKAMPNAERLAVMEERFGIAPTTEQAQRSMMTWEELDEMREWVDVQSHGLFHPLLPTCSERELREELVQSKRVIEEKLGGEVFAFAYPYGIAGERERAAVAAAGYIAARAATDNRLVSVVDDPFALTSICVDDDDDLRALEGRLRWAELATLRRVLTGWRHKWNGRPSFPRRPPVIGRSRGSSEP